MRAAPTLVTMTEKSEFESESAARHYAQARPGYPAELYDALDDLLNGGLAGAHVVDVAAGTGIAARELAERGARVTAVELSAAMLGRLVADSAGVAAVQGSGHALPLATHSADLVGYAQAWHWMDKDLAIAEARRVLRPRGVLAAWWNVADYGCDWQRAQSERVGEAAPDWHRYAAVEVAAREGLVPGRPTQAFEFRWERTISIETHLANLASMSYISGLDDEGAGFLGRERAVLNGLFPDGRVTECYRTLLLASLVGAGLDASARQGS